jgi:hypothetical protein
MTKNELITKMYREGASRRKIALATGLSPSQVQYRIYTMLELNVKYPRNDSPEQFKKIDSEVINRIITLTSWGYREREIAEDQGITRNVVRQVIEENSHRIVKKV